MPVVARFYGITIKLYFSDHTPPHFHAIYGEYNGLFNIKTLELIEGDLPKRAKNLILEWAKIHQNELMDIWEKQEFRTIEGLE